MNEIPDRLQHAKTSTNILSYFASHSSPGARERSEAPHTHDRPFTSHETSRRPPQAPRTSHEHRGFGSRQPGAVLRPESRRERVCARPFVVRAEAHAGCSAVTIARASPTGTSAIDLMALMFAAALLLKMVRWCRRRAALTTLQGRARRDL